MDAGGLERINRLALMAATTCAIPFFFLMLATGLVTGQSGLAVGSTTPLAVALVGLWQLSRPEPRAIAQLITGAVMTVIYMYAVDTASRGGAVTAVVSLGMTGVLFLRSHYAVYLVGYSVGILATAFWLEGTNAAPGDRVMGSVGSVLLFLFAALMILWLKREMEAGRARYRSLFERAPVGIWEADFSAVAPWLAQRRAEGVTDLAGHFDANPEQVHEALLLIEVLDVNLAAVALMEGSRKRQLLGNVLPDRLPPGWVEVGLGALVGLWDGTDSGQLETSVTTLRGQPLTVVASWTIPRHHGELDLGSVVTTVSNVTRLKRAEQRLERLVRSKDEFVASVSHELRTPLTSVVGFAKELDARFESFDDDERQEMIAMIADQASEMSYIIEDLLVAARRDVRGVTIQHVAFDMRREVATVLRDMGADAGLLVVDLDIDIDLPLTWADPARVRQILRNLFVNALRYGGGNVAVRLRAGRSSMVEVRDDGGPIPASEQDSIFHAYYRAHEAPGLAESVGLGLTVSRQLARLMHGDVTYHHDGASSVFTLRLPIAGPDRAPRPERERGPLRGAATG